MEWLSSEFFRDAPKEVILWTVLLIFSISVHTVAKHFAPVLAERFRQRTHRMVERDAERADNALTRLNGKFAEAVKYAIKEALKDSVELQHLVDERVLHKMGSALTPFSIEAGQRQKRIEALEKEFHDHREEALVHIRNIDHLQYEQTVLAKQLSEVSDKMDRGWDLLVRIAEKLKVEEKGRR